ncbi:type III polyketide synthase [Streptomyces sp. DSM 44915]|uniref:Type III polyketide synthase n=1 Tax=Streptomyces chisholmiae TaxID=3075540 RepID=A0ABU2JW29_9ACTN|nr:type III polyketide synthase [Streptomyces sp. DSM 44915]MDT0268744.1 type III polyketide synthase [Streptomyces sp. DSM 44915]
MAVLCRPAVQFPDHEITLADTVGSARRLHPDHPRLATAVRLIENTGVRTRRLLQPLDETLRHPGVAARTELYWTAVRGYLPDVVQAALDQAELTRDRIDAVVFVSCTGFTMPSPIVWMINELGFSTRLHQLPVAQLGCAAGSSAISNAARYCRAFPDHNVLIVACELCSLCYQPTETDVGSLLAAGLFGDGFAAAVMRGAGGRGLRVGPSAAETIPHTADWISYEVRETGFHFRLDSRVRDTMRAVTPGMAKLVADAGWSTGDLDFVVAHAGGPRILDDLTTYLDIDPAHHRFSRAALAEHGNTASVLIFDALARLFDDDVAGSGARGLVAGFGPGVSADFSLGVFI